MPAWLHKLDEHFPVRYLAWLVCGLATLTGGCMWITLGVGAPATLAFALLTVIGARDVLQTQRSILRN